ncbi:TonB-dependent receptor plug domain-containing protein [Simiduia agarivorans]|uniref:TonB-dependent receptor n=1 Tax=Simiduia agarivorans (strain DSM 21679 / JCM 13881 / BCRC 17597 / SA1) TaxID=1117647 RepID=K4KJU1_SIMAS|nr:TonB-dependent receptor [Simiduia agarivorans]AFU98495.1 TonB-dependent receptor [Simiduia agarivorans SA1 = DSM 21679]
MKGHSLALLLPSLLVLSAGQLQAQEQQGFDIEEIISIGTRASGRTVTDSLVPVDVISERAIVNSGAVDTADMLRKLAPSFNMNNTTTSDGQDVMRPATLRSLAPDQVLVLVNGKRRHQFALVAVQENVGRGSAGTDLSAIPLSAIKRVEILRDGAAAQYGSDAIAGVINIVLKDADGANLWGQYRTTAEGDGTTYKAGGHWGRALAEGGHVNVTYEYVDAGSLNRASPSDWFGASPVTRQLVLVGEPDVTSHNLWFNASLPLGTGSLYSFGGFSEKRGESLGFFRGPDDGRVWTALYPDGVTPELGTDTEDRSFALGYRWLVSDWDMDLSYVWGQNRIAFSNLRSLNASYGPDGPTRAYDGALINQQQLFNIDAVRGMELGRFGNVSVALGAEVRTDRFKQQAGDEVSYARGDTLCDENFVNSNDPGKDPLTCSFDNGSGAQVGITAPGMQGFQGYSPDMAISASRDSQAVYGDVEFELSDRLHMGAALRYEHFDDFGGATNGKLTGRYDLTDALALRAAWSSGFRAPGMQQAWFTQRSISLDNGELADLVTLRPNDALAAELGFKPLREETSQNFSVGLTYTGARWTSSLDWYSIDIADRVVYSGNISRTGDPVHPVDQFFDRYDGPGEALDGVRNVSVFTNAVDTRTTGLDWVNEWGFDLDAGATLVLEASLHLNNTRIDQINTSSSIVPDSWVFDDSQALLLTRAQPRERGIVALNYSRDAWRVTGRANYYGPVTSASYGTPQHTWSAKTLFDLTAQWALGAHWVLAGGVLNVLDTRPDTWGEDGFPFTELGFNYGWTTFPFSLAGREYYLRATWQF